MSSSSQRAKGKAPMVIDASHELDLDEEWKIAHIRFSIEGMESYIFLFGRNRRLQKRPKSMLSFFGICERILCLLSSSARHLETQGPHGRDAMFVVHSGEGKRS
ncbi:hypothetical protein HAX54_013911 [Datura stramonium]|uniref:Uncharacterized protein n=1 Tax=Datura stramonium TaxID=4076 RepID=A0ABS8TN37_DATST|nr:hypothetical protein [Datura stramonium]